MCCLNKQPASQLPYLAGWILEIGTLSLNEREPAKHYLSFGDIGGSVNLKIA